MEIKVNSRLVTAFVRWIEKFDAQHARNWARLYLDNREAAMCEATFWGVLQDRGVRVEPNCDLHTDYKAPDFVCWKDDSKFYFEAKCIEVETATSKTALPHEPSNKFQVYSNLNDKIYQLCKVSTRQCAGLDAPCVLGIGTFHFEASVLCVSKDHLEELLTGEQSLGWGIDVTRGCAVGEPYSVTHLRSAAFIKPSDESMVGPARCPLSALVVGGFGCTPPQLLGLLHPQPVHRFDPTLLGRLEFCRLANPIGELTFSTEWD